ncbi:MAG: hypothetical protein EBU96_09325 [Actinobacteria bacterium]|nr:hypothetical protein [Actinomycetota bacterium]
MAATPQDNYGYFGPDYDFAANIPLPGEVGVRQEASIGAIIDSIGGVNYYVDTIGFGGPTFFDSHNPQPMGARFFLNTGTRCSNGASMSAYLDGVTKGDLCRDSKVSRPVCLRMHGMHWIHAPFLVLCLVRGIPSVSRCSVLLVT